MTKVTRFSSCQGQIYYASVFPFDGALPFFEFRGGGFLRKPDRLRSLFFEIFSQLHSFMSYATFEKIDFRFEGRTDNLAAW